MSYDTRIAIRYYKSSNSIGVNVYENGAWKSVKTIAQWQVSVSPRIKIPDVSDPVVSYPAMSCISGNVHIITGYRDYGTEGVSQSQFALAADGVIRRRTRRQGGSWSSWEDIAGQYSVSNITGKFTFNGTTRIVFGSIQEWPWHINMKTGNGLEAYILRASSTKLQLIYTDANGNSSVLRTLQLSVSKQTVNSEVSGVSYGVNASAQQMQLTYSFFDPASTCGWARAALDLMPTGMRFRTRDASGSWTVHWTKQLSVSSKADFGQFASGDVQITVPSSETTRLVFRYKKSSNIVIANVFTDGKWIGEKTIASWQVSVSKVDVVDRNPRYQVFFFPGQYTIAFDYRSEDNKLYVNIKDPNGNWKGLRQIASWQIPYPDSRKQPIVVSIRKGLYSGTARRLLSRLVIATAYLDLFFGSLPIARIGIATGFNIPYPKCLYTE